MLNWWDEYLEPREMKGQRTGNYKEVHNLYFLLKIVRTYSTEVLAKKYPYKIFCFKTGLNMKTILEGVW
jgi:hypothetical protein